MFNYSASFLALNAKYQAEEQASRRLVAGLLTLSRHPRMDIQPQPRERFEASRARLRASARRFLSNATDA